MRILAFDRHWPKLDEPMFTTFRYPRRDRDWQTGEIVSLVVNPTSRFRDCMGTAIITSITPYAVCDISDSDAYLDGFDDAAAMRDWLKETYHNDDRWIENKPINKLTLRKLGS